MQHHNHTGRSEAAPGAWPEPLIVVVGSINADVVLRVSSHPLPGETVLATSMTVHPGGKGANQAVAAARLGAAVAFIGAVGDDAYADAALRGMHEAHVETSGVISMPGPTGQAFVTVDQGTGENFIVVVPGANAQVNAASVNTHRELLKRAAIIMLQGEISPDAAAAAVTGSATRLILNLAPVIPLAKEVILRANPLVVNQHEGRLTLKMLGRDVDDVDTDGKVLEALLAEGIRSVVITLGADGAVFSEGGAIVHISAPVVDAVDTTGAGDAFVGALSARIAAGAPMKDAVDFAVRVGSFAVGSHGAQPSYPQVADKLPGGTE